MTDQIKQEIISVSTRDTLLQKDILKHLDTTEFILLTNDEMTIKAGQGECIFLLGKKFYYTTKFLGLSPIYKAIYFYLEWQYQSYYLSGKNINSNSATLLLQEDTYNTEYITNCAMELLISLGIIAASDYDYRYTGGCNHFVNAFNDMKNQFLKAYTPHLNEEQLREQLQKCYDFFSTQVVFCGSDQVFEFQKTLPQLTKEKAKTYLYHLIVEQDNDLGEVEFLLEFGPYVYFNAKIPVAPHPYQYKRLTYLVANIPKLLYSKETGILHSSRSSEYRKFRNQTTTVRHMLNL